MTIQVEHYFFDVGVGVEREQEAVVQFGAPTHERFDVRLRPETRDERTDEQRLHERHSGMRWHLEAAQFEQAEPAALRIGTEQLVDAELGPMRAAGDIDEEVTEQAVDEPRRRRCARRGGRRSSSANAISSSYRLSWRASSTRGAWLVGPMNRPEKRYESEGWCCQYVMMLRSRSGRRSIGLSAGGRAAERQVIAAAGAGVGAVEMERLCAEAGGAGVGVHAQVMSTSSCHEDAG